MTSLRPHAKRWHTTGTLVSSLEQQLACSECGKGKVSGRPLLLLTNNEWVCLHCARPHLGDATIEVLRRKYRHEYNERNLSHLIRFCEGRVSFSPVCADFLGYIRAAQSVPPALLAKVREMSKEL